MFERGQKYDRDQVREYLGSGHTQAGVMWSTQRPLKRPNEVVITSGGRHAKKAGYKDRRHSSGSWIYYGQGREGDQNLDSAANKKIRDQNNVLLLFHTKEPTAAEAQAAGNHRKSYEFVGSFRCREWGTKKIHTGKRVGDILVRFYLEPSLWKERSTGTIKPIQKRDACVMTTQVEDLIDMVPDDPLAWELVAKRVRKYQAKFRKAVLSEYNSTCCITGETMEKVLQAAHVIPHSEGGSNETANSMLLRSDIHNLFDGGLLDIDPLTRKVILSAGLESSGYADLNGAPLATGKTGAPSSTLLKKRKGVNSNEGEEN